MPKPLVRGAASAEPLVELFFIPIPTFSHQGKKGLFQRYVVLSNPMKHKLLAGGPAFGVSVMFPSPHIVDIIGRLGFDWVLIDCEHGSISIESVELMVLAAEAANITPIGRPATNAPEAIGQLMDRGVMGVQVPHVNTAEDARRAVEAVKYHPLGERGLAAGLRSSSYGFGISMSEYAEESNRETLVCVQLEEGQAVRNVDEIMSVEGVDVYFVGPSDLSQSLGHPGRPDVPEVREAMEHVFSTVRSKGKISGSAGNAAATLGYLGQGVTYLYTHLTALLSTGAGAYLKEVSG
jgi:4-hydroxy-2-oxoheptanedioate aldolase